MLMYLRTKFQVSSITLGGSNLTPPPVQFHNKPLKSPPRLGLNFQNQKIKWKRNFQIMNYQAIKEYLLNRHGETEKTNNFSTSVSETSENVCLFVFISWLVSSGVCININSKQKISSRVNQKNIKRSRKKYVMWTCFKFWSMKNILSFKVKTGILPLWTKYVS